MLPKLLLGLLPIAALAAAFVGSAPAPTVIDEPAPAGSESIVVAAGCFWCVEGIFEELKGVSSVESAYVGGPVKNPTYEAVCSGTTGHAEAVKIVYDPKVVSAADLLRLFFVTHDPTTLNRQGPDSGTQYRSAIFYSTPEEKELAEKIRKEISDKKIWRNPIVTTIEPMLNYTRAEEYHQNYFAKYEKATPAQRMRMNAGYCANIVEPKVRKFRKEYSNLLKKKE